MDRERLGQYKDLKRELNFLRGKISKLNESVESDIVTGSNIEYPYNLRKVYIQGVPKHSRIRERYYKKLERCEKLQVDIEEFIDNINDSQIRLIFELRYLEGWSWKRVARQIGSHNEATPRSIHDRYLKKII